MNTSLVPAIVASQLLHR